MMTVRNLRNQHLQIKMFFSLTTNNIYVVINAQKTEQKKLEKLSSYKKNFSRSYPNSHKLKLVLSEDLNQ